MIMADTFNNIDENHIHQQRQMDSLGKLDD